MPGDIGDIGAVFEAVKTWGRWGADDQRGALNLITPERTLAAARLVVEGVTVSCGRDLGTIPEIDDPRPTLHMMLLAGDALETSGIPGFTESMDFLGINCHGMSVSHIDALCHIFVDGKMYNGYPASDVKSTGASRNAIAAGAGGGIVGRGVLLDPCRQSGRAWFEPAELIGADLLEQCCAEQHTDVGPGDIVLVHTGRDARRQAVGPWNLFDPGLPGLAPDCIPWFADRQVSVIGTDVIADPLPIRTTSWPFPVHQCCIAAMGVHLMDNLALADLSGACARSRRWEFLFAVGPLRALRATGSPVSPVAVL